MSFANALKMTSSRPGGPYRTACEPPARPNSIDLKNVTDRDKMTPVVARN